MSSMSDVKGSLKAEKSFILIPLLDFLFSIEPPAIVVRPSDIVTTLMRSSGQ